MNWFISFQLVAGIIHCPILGETYHAVKGQGAFCNSERLAVSRLQGKMRGYLYSKFSFGEVYCGT